jgi:hypothetical protein
VSVAKYSPIIGVERAATGGRPKVLIVSGSLPGVQP